MKRTAFVAFLIFAAVFGWSDPSSAAVTASSLSIVGPNPLTAKCPVNVGFTGTISGSPGTIFTYSFNRFVNSVQKVVNGATVTMPSSGSIAVNDSVPISSSTSGSTFDQIWVHNISGGQADVYSNTANFTVTCQSGGAGAVMHVLIVSTAVPTPTGVVSTRDINLCAAHINMLFCKAAINAGQEAIVWEWSGNATYPSLDGYKVYRVDRGHNDLVVTTSAGDGFHGTFIGAAGIAYGRCYVVTGYKGSNESARSAQTCVGN